MKYKYLSSKILNLYEESNCMQVKFDRCETNAKAAMHFLRSRHPTSTCCFLSERSTGGISRTKKIMVLCVSCYSS